MCVSRPVRKILPSSTRPREREGEIVITCNNINCRMAKRKCVRQAIIEMSDSDAEGTKDDSVISKSVTPPSKTNNRSAAGSRSSNKRDIKRPRRSRSSNAGDSQEKLNDKSTKESSVVERKMETAICEEEKPVKRGRKRKISKTDVKIGSCASKDENSGVEAERTEVRQTIQQPYQRVSITPEPESQAADKAKQSAATQRSVSPQSEPKSDDTEETYIARLQASNIQCVEWSIIDYVKEENRISSCVAENILRLLESDNTIPFIARYRKEMTQGMDAEELRRVKNSYDKAKLIKQRAAAIIREIDKQGNWTVEFHAFVHGTKSLDDLEYIHSMFKVTESSLVEKAKKVGLGTHAEAVFSGIILDSLSDLVMSETEGLKTEEQVKDGIVCIIADMINKDQRTFDKIKELRTEYSMQIRTTKVESSTNEEPKTDEQKNEETEYDLYHNFSSAEMNLKPHQILTINRGEARNVLSVNVDVPDLFGQELKGHCFYLNMRAVRTQELNRMLMTVAISHAYNKSTKAFIERRTRQEMTERAEVASIDVFAEKVKQLLLTPPMRGKVVVGIDPGFRDGCKLAVVSEQGDMLATETIYPHDMDNPKAKDAAEQTLVRLVLEHKCNIFALGNGTACSETEVFLANLIKKGAFKPLDVDYTIVDATGTSIYSCSPEATSEFPNLNVNLISAVSIARRLQDPMTELVKIEPKHLGGGMCQDDLPEEQLAAKLNEVITEAVSFVGVDVNTASVSLLKRVAGLDESKAKNIIEWRKSSGPFRTRNDLTKVKDIDKKTFEQCAGFIRIMPETAVSNVRQKSRQKSLEYLDQTWIHPESYSVAKKFLKAAECNILHLGTRPFIFAVNFYAETLGHEDLAKKLNTTVETIEVIVKGLTMKKGHDIRGKGDASMFRKSLTSMDDLKDPVVLTGAVRNITDET